MPRPGEDEIIARFLAPLAGAGGLGLLDDAAIVAPAPGHELVVTKDMLVAGVHFFPDDPAASIARKALRVNLSDLAAKAAEPVGFLLGLSLPRDWTEGWLAAFADGLGADARAHGCPLLGGDTVGTAGPLTISVTAMGQVPAGGMVPRGGARDGDRLFVTGTIGDAALGLLVRGRRPEDRGWSDALAPEHRDALLDAYLHPRPRVAMREALRAHARCAMDVSDGLLGDLGKMLRLASLGAAVAAADIPLSAAAAAAVAAEPRLLAVALTGGDDYEILGCVPPAAAGGFAADAEAAGCPVGWIGTASAEHAGVTAIAQDGTTVLGRRYQHFQ